MKSAIVNSNNRYGQVLALLKTSTVHKLSKVSMSSAVSWQSLWHMLFNTDDKGEQCFVSFNVIITLLSTVYQNGNYYNRHANKDMTVFKGTSVHVNRLKLSC